MRSSSAVLLILAAVSGSCRNPAEPPEFTLLLAIEDSVVAKRSPNEVNFSVSVRVSNQDSRTVYYNDCGHALQRREGSQWRTVHSPRCGASTYSVGLFTGESRLFDFVARAPVTSTEWPAVGGAGEYRVVLWLTAVPNNSYGFAPQPLGSRSRISPTFSAKEVVIVF